MRTISKIIIIIIWLNNFVNLGYGQEKCNNYQWKCQNDQCISNDELCDGHVNCSDGSDENGTICGQLHTTNITNKVIRQINQMQSLRNNQNGCRVTYIPNLIVKTEADNKHEILPGDYVENFEGITYSCQKRHLLKGVAQNHCFDNEWSQPLPVCLKYCNYKVLRSVTIQPTCEFNGSTISCDMPILPGTRVTIACEFGYQKPSFGVSDNLNCGNDGEWDFLPYRCEQVCGEEYPDYRPFILGGTKTNNTKVPWNVAIYSSLEEPNKQICGGTIVSAKIVISAAHCFWNVTKARKNDKSYYKVGAGKYYRDYNAVEPLPVQFSDVEEIHINDGYKDIQLSYINDIAVVVLKKYLKFTFYIKPACLKWNRYSQQSLKSKLIGRVAGWGKTDTGLPSNELNTVELSTLSYDDCLEKTQREYQILITGDKFCVGSKDGQTVCQGDSGAGFLIPIDLYGVKRFVLQGIVSNGINSNEQCTGDFLTAYTNIQYFREMVEAYMNQFKLESQDQEVQFTPTESESDQGGCRVTYSHNIIVKTVGDNPQNILPGEIIPDFVGVAYSCEQRLLLNGAKENYCVDSKWSETMPTCIKYCNNTILHSITRQSTCKFNGTTVSCDMPILPGTSASIECAFGYQKPSLEVHDHLFCGSNGEWDYLPYQCEQICGEQQPDVNPFIVGGIKTNNTKVPWHVSLYVSASEPNIFICGGTILSARIVLSAAHCSWISDHPQDYKVGAGKYYYDYNAKEPLPVQYLDVEEIKLGARFDGIYSNLQNNIALLVLKNYIKFNFYIKPACLKWDEYSEISVKSNLIGLVAGWGITATGLPSTELNTVELSTLSYPDCLAKTKEEYKMLITGDKFCVNNKDGKAVCRGDSGGGFLIPELVKGVKRYFIHGVLSNGINSNSNCTGEFITTYSNVQYFKQMIQSYMNQFKVA